MNVEEIPISELKKHPEIIKLIDALKSYCDIEHKDYWNIGTKQDNSERLLKKWAIDARWYRFFLTDQTETTDAKGD